MHVNGPVGGVNYGRRMRILHTSDWHIGRTFHGADLLADQEPVLDAVAGLVAEHAVDVVLVAGDVYDRAVPCADAVTVCDTGFEAIRAAGAAIVVTSGQPRLPGRGSAPARPARRPAAAPDDAGRRSWTGRCCWRTSTARSRSTGCPYLEPEARPAELGLPPARSHAAILERR